MRVVLTTLTLEDHGTHFSTWASRFMHLLFLSSTNLGMPRLEYVDHAAHVNRASRSTHLHQVDTLSRTYISFMSAALQVVVGRRLYSVTTFARLRHTGHSSTSSLMLGPVNMLATTPAIAS